MTLMCVNFEKAKNYWKFSKPMDQILNIFGVTPTISNNVQTLFLNKKSSPNQPILQTEEASFSTSLCATMTPKILPTECNGNGVTVTTASAFLMLKQLEFIQQINNQMSQSLGKTSFHIAYFGTYPFCDPPKMGWRGPYFLMTPPRRIQGGTFGVVRVRAI